MIEKDICNHILPLFQPFESKHHSVHVCVNPSNSNRLSISNWYLSAVTQSWTIELNTWCVVNLFSTYWHDMKGFSEKNIHDLQAA